MRPKLALRFFSLASESSPVSKFTVDDVIDDTVVREIEKEGFVERLYR